MREALAEAKRAASEGEVPVGALILDQTGHTLSRGRNAVGRVSERPGAALADIEQRRETRADPTGHAEIRAIRAAAELRGTPILDDCTLVVTLEPCVMCAGAILAARLRCVVIGAWDDKAGAAGSVYDVLRDGRLPHPVPEVIGGVLAEESAVVLATFFQQRR